MEEYGKILLFAMPAFLIFVLSEKFYGMWKGKDGAVMDFVVQFLGSAEQAKARYEKEISPEFKVYLEGYCKGLNDYATAHPKEVKVKKAFPITPCGANPLNVVVIVPA
jgi:acyl-homoserine-lactone acylase